MVAPARMNPTHFASLTLIAAPAILTNASSILVLSTSNRLARAVNRARSLAKQLEGTNEFDGPPASFTSDLPLARVEKRAIFLLRALRLFYLSLGSFAAASFTSLLGASFSATGAGAFYDVTVFVAAAAGLSGVGGLVVGTGMLVGETRIAVTEVTDEIHLLRARLLRGASGVPDVSP